MPAVTRDEIAVLVEAIAGEVSSGTASAIGSIRSHGIDEDASPEASVVPCPPKAEADSLTANLRRLAGLIDHTLLRPDATRPEILTFCGEALDHAFAAVCVNPAWVPLVARELSCSEVRVATVVGFPMGATFASSKRAEAEAALRAGAQEIDMVMNVGALRSGDFECVESDIRGVVEVCHGVGAVVKVILENAFLTDAEKVRACRIAERAGADFVKTSTGFGPSGATEGDVRLMRASVGPTVGVKAAGGIRTLAVALGMLKAGANRLGTSAGVAILGEGTRGKN